MSKDEAYDILATMIKNALISDMVFDEKLNAQALASTLAYIDGTVDVLNEVLRNQTEQRLYADVKRKEQSSEQ